MASTPTSSLATDVAVRARRDLTSAEHATAIAEAAHAAASTGTRGDGIVAVQPVESVLRIRSGSPVPPDEI
jgi:nitrogen regulatory protein PII